MGRIRGNKNGDSVDVKFWRSVDWLSGGVDGCWNWTACTTVFGHGVFAPFQHFKVRAHRYVWELINGPIPAGLDCCHHCDNPRCVRPDHLFIGTRTDNMRDAAQKKRTMRREGHVFAKLTQEKADEIRELRKSGVSFANISRTYGVSWSTVRRVVNRVPFGGWA
jgi:hypothetical protein